MSLSKDIIRDLLPVYVAGEASAATREAVEIALTGDAELRGEAERIGSVPALDAMPSPSVGVEALKRTQRLLRRRALVAGCSVFFSTLPMALVDRPWGVAGRLCATASLLLAAVGWILFFRNAWRLQVAGLEGLRSPHPRIAWYLATAVFAFSTQFVIQDWSGVDLSRWGIVIVFLFWLPVMWIGRRLGQLRDPSEIRDVESLFDLARDPDAHV